MNEQELQQYPKQDINFSENQESINTDFTYPQQQPTNDVLDSENQKEQLGQALNKEEEEIEEDSNLLGNSRLGFIRKVFILLTLMLSVVVLSTGLSMSIPAIRQFQASNVWLYYTFLGIGICTEILVFCNSNLARRVPTNYILCSIFTLSFAYMVSAICGIYAEAGLQNLVFIAAALTLGITVALTMYALKTKKDFTMLGGFLWSLCMTFILASILQWIFYTSFTAIILSSLGVLLYGLYLVYDVQLIVGEKREKLEYDDYILGAMLVFIDIIMIFLHILRILGESN